MVDRIVTDGYLRDNLDIYKKAVKKDRDCLIVIDGYEREGKSTMAAQVAKYLDPTYNVDRCCFNPREFANKIKGIDEKYKAIVLDEGQGLSARKSMHKLNIILNEVLAEVGMKNLFLIICIPSFFELDRYPAIHRSMSLIHIYSKKFKRGNFLFWSRKSKKRLYKAGKRWYSYRWPAADFRGSFSSKFPIDSKKYNEKKKKAVNKPIGDRKSSRVRKLEKQRKALIKWLYNNLKKSQTKIGKKIGITQEAISKIIKK